MSVRLSNKLSAKANGLLERFGSKSLIVFMTAGLVCLGTGYSHYQSARVDSSWQHAHGTTISYLLFHDPKAPTSTTGLTYAPNVQFSAKGATYIAKGTHKSPQVPILGTNHEVAYNPADPSQAAVVDEPPISLLTGLLALAGLCLLVGAPLLYRKASRRRHAYDDVEEDEDEPGETREDAPPPSQPES